MALNWFMPAKAKGSGRVSAKQAAGRHVEGGEKKAVLEDKREKPLYCRDQPPITLLSMASSSLKGVLSPIYV
jgi:hypothetical protein